MISEIQIENLGVITRSSLQFSPGLTVITGETGAGKTMVLNSIALLSGKKADTALVRRGKEFCRISGIFEIKGNQRVQSIVEKAGGSTDEGELICTRQVPLSGRSRAVAGGVPVPANTLAELADSLLTVHGQSDQLLLRSSAAQLQLLDRFLGKTHLTQLATYRQIFNELSRLKTELKIWEQQSANRELEIRDLKNGLELLENLQPQVGEENELVQSIAKLSNVDALREHLVTAQRCLSSDNSEIDILSQLAVVESALEKAQRFDADLKNHEETIKQAGYLLSDLQAELSAYLSDLGDDGQLLESQQQRLAALRHAARNWAAEVDDWITWGEQAAVRLTEISGPNNHGDCLQAQIAELGEKASKMAKEISCRRSKGAQTLQQQVHAELTQLAMGSVQFQVQVKELEELGKHGCDQVVFGLASEGSNAIRPLGQGASGGELSRIMLALEVVVGASRLRNSAAFPLTYIFDEVDSGIGGQTALAVGQRLAKLAQHTQVIVVTHLPQVAAWGNTHLVVQREGDQTQVKEVNDYPRQQEIARMLSGKVDSKSALLHAEELLSSCIVP